MSTCIFNIRPTEEKSRHQRKEQEVENIEEGTRTCARFRCLKLLVFVLIVEIDFVPVKLLSMSKTWSLLSSDCIAWMFSLCTFSEFLRPWHFISCSARVFDVVWRICLVFLQCFPLDADLEESAWWVGFHYRSQERCFYLALGFWPVFDFLFCESDAKSYGCDIFHRTLLSCVTVLLLQLRTLPQGPWVSCKMVFGHLSSHRVAPIAHCALYSHRQRSWVFAPFIDPRRGAWTHRRAAQRACFFPSCDKIYLRPSDRFSFR